MKRLLFCFACCWASLSLTGQSYIKLNGLYALAGVINPAIEIPLSPRSSFQSEVVYSPWKSVSLKGISGPMQFGLFLNEYRRYFRQRNEGWYLAGNAGVLLFNVTKPIWQNGFRLDRKSAKGYGMTIGIAGGYAWQPGDGWLIDLFFGWSYLSSYYNGYALVDGLIEGGNTYHKGELILTPHGHEHYSKPDPWNGSAEWLPNKIGISVGRKIGRAPKRGVKR